MSTGKEAFSLTRFVLPSVFMQKVHFQLTCVAKKSLCFTPGGGEGGYLLIVGLCICHWMGLHFHDSIDYCRVAFLQELLEWGRIFSGF